MKKLGLVFAIAAVAAMSGDSVGAAEHVQVTDDWSIEITPATRAAVAATDAADADAASVDPGGYERIYAAIPFQRAEYNTNPGYRHDSTMEILTGNPRHQTIVRHDNRRTTPLFSRDSALIPYRYNNLRWGMNYSFYFPYWNYRGLY